MRSIRNSCRLFLCLGKADKVQRRTNQKESSGLGTPTDEPLKKPRKYLDTITFFPNTKDCIFEVCAPLYAQGLSLREIERQTGFVKTTIKKTLNAEEVWY